MSKFQEGDRVYIPKENRYGEIMEYDESDNSYGVWSRIPGKTYGILRFYSESSLEKVDEDD